MINNWKIIYSNFHLEVYSLFSCTTCCHEIVDSFYKLNLFKDCDPDNIEAEHLKFCNLKINTMISLCLNSCLEHGLFFINMLLLIIISVNKNKNKGISIKSYLRFIALSIIISKKIESVIYNHIQNLLISTDNQFRLKTVHGTDLCVYALKEAMLKYNVL